MQNEYKTIYILEYMGELFSPAFENKEDAERYIREECNYNYRAKPITLYTTTDSLCLDCNAPSDGYFFCASCFEKRQGSS